MENECLLHTATTSVIIRKGIKKEQMSKREEAKEMKEEENKKRYDGEKKERKEGVRKRK